MLALESLQESGVQCLAGSLTVRGTLLDEASAGYRASASSMRWVSFAFTSLVEGELERRLHVRVRQVNTFQGAISEITAHPLDDAPRTAPRPRRTARKGKQVSDSF